jgi:hypothetical protein
MIAEIVSPLLTLLLIAIGFSVMLRGFRGPSRRGLSARGGGPSYLHAFLFSVFLPAVWWTLALLGRMYQRCYVVFTEFLTGVPDWVSYRTSAPKYLGAALAFLAYNVAILVALSLLLGRSGPWATSLGGLLVVGAAGLTIAVGARACMRRAP